MTAGHLRRATFYQRRGKRALDVGLGGTLLVVSLPVQAVVALLVAWNLGRPVIFRQERPGRGAQAFTILKFRTMNDQRDAHGRPLPDETRLTRFGQLLRASSLDELPELWNVARGDMSLVGPRPLLVKYLPLYTSTQARRHEVRPGLTGWAQVNGRNQPGWHDRLAMDVWYVDHVTLRGDLRILSRTLAEVLRRRGISAEGHATAPEFTGIGRDLPGPVDTGQEGGQ